MYLRFYRNGMNYLVCIVSNRYFVPAGIDVGMKYM